MDHIPHRSLVTRLAVLTAALLLATSSPATAKKDTPDGMVSEIRDDRIQESSGLALSAKHEDLTYTMNDEGGDGARVYAVQVSTGEVVGTADISGLPIQDPESIAVDAAGTLWLGDLGDNDHNRSDIAIYAFPEPGPGEQSVSGADRYQVTLPDGPQDVEGLLVHPQTDRVFLVSKNEEGTGRIFALPDLVPGGTAQADDIGEAPEGVTDATFTHSGQWALLRTEKDLWIFNPETWQAVSRVETPDLEKGESVAVERGDRTVLLGSEGKNSPIVRVALPDVSAASPIQLDDGDDDGSTVENALELAIPLVLLAAAMLVVGIIAQRRLKI
jgi:hypothetical protein